MAHIIYQDTCMTNINKIIHFCETKCRDLIDLSLTNSSGLNSKKPGRWCVIEQSLDFIYTSNMLLSHWQLCQTLTSYGFWDSSACLNCWGCMQTHKLTQDNTKAEPSVCQFMPRWTSVMLKLILLLLVPESIWLLFEGVGVWKAHI